jgi:CubicO group peptidase (beta-lactamase class C family)
VSEKDGKNGVFDFHLCADIGVHRYMSETLPKLPLQDDVEWPTMQWDRGDLLPGTNRRALEVLLTHAFQETAPDEMGETHAFLAIQKGGIVADRYWQGFDRMQTYPSWSMAKSITHALAGIMVGDGLVDPMEPVLAPEWGADDDKNDRRRLITLDQLLRMSSGLHFVEEYYDGEVSSVIEMLYGEGKGDVAAYAAAQPMAYAPDSRFYYSSGTTNIISRFLSQRLGKSGDEFADFMKSALFDRIGISTATPKFDGQGTFIGSSFCFCTAEDFARFGLLYLRDGIWDGERILPEGWVDYARTATPTPPDEPLGYGAHWWLGLCGPGSFSANGFHGQYIALLPDKDLILVRHGKSPQEQGDQVRVWLRKVSECFPTVQ